VVTHRAGASPAIFPTTDAGSPTYRHLDPDKIVETVGALCKRVAVRFPGSGLGQVSRELLAISHEAKWRAAWMAKPQRLLRAVTGVVIVLIVLVPVEGLVRIGVPRGPMEFGQLVQAMAAGLDVIVLLGAAVVFLVTAEIRIKRARALRAIHVLRAMAHVVDMHQLTKDPEVIAGREAMTPGDLIRYLDYCTDLLSLIGKIGALYAQHVTDSVVLQAVNDVENQTTGLAQKIWQKITLVQAFERQR
jgi:hypothetical protein